ncbi:MAG: hydantoinase/oxoprolinase family protein [Desulfovibrionaceae bacterium]|nr:hydantoinase/oxoprolinase family protein [Desulfovibrionaceae bacterium]
MILGIDVGGTHTDAVAVDLGSGRIAAACKVPTDHEDLLSSIVAALTDILGQVDKASVSQLNLSTTLATNAIVQGKTEDVGLLVSAGPGIDPDNYMLCRDYHVLPGAIDHRGFETRRLDPGELDRAVAACRGHGCRVFAAVGKFSVRNPVHENAIRRQVNKSGPADFVTAGHELGGRLNFPRRIATAYFNCAVWRLYNTFADAVHEALDRLGLGHVAVNVLKADGGTSPFVLSRRLPVQSIFSGPAASVMGIIALCDINFDSIILDIGGTTTDIAVFASGAPLVEHDGIHIGSHPTLVRALKVRSIGIGGDSAVYVIGDLVRVGPNRLGPCLAAGGRHPTLTDALNCIGACAHGDVQASQQGLAAFAQERSLSREALAQKAVDFAARAIKDEVRDLVREINERPVYTIHELLEGQRIVPRKIYIMGGPAQAMRQAVFQAFSLSVEVPGEAAVANAVGAALTRITRGIELFADTEKGAMFIPALGHRENVPRTYGLKDAERDIKNQLLGHLAELGAPADASAFQITQASCFNMVKDAALSGKNIRVKCQITPGVVRTLRR